MRRRWLALGASTGALVFLFTAYSHSPAPIASSRNSASDSPERVRIEHQLVRIPVTPPVKPPVKVASTPRGRSPRPAPAPALARREASRPLLARTIRRILGDGRYTPEPFPRAR